MKTLIIHHLERAWEYGYIIEANLTFEQLCRKVAGFIKWEARREPFDKVILTKWADNQMSAKEYRVLFDLVNEVHNYMFGWDIYDVDNDLDPSAKRERLEEDGELIDKNGTVYVQGGYHSVCVQIANWMTELPKEKVYICGAFDGECIEDLEIALKYLEVDYKRVPSLII